MSPGSWRRRRRGPLVVMAALALACAAAVGVVLLREPRNISHPRVPFTTATTPPREPKAAVRDFLWPTYGYDVGRTRLFAAGAHLEPPFRRGWTYGGTGALLEFPPVIRNNFLYLINDSGVALAIDKLTGHVVWHRKVGTLAAASPALGNGLVFVPLLSTRPGATQPAQGRFVALSQRTGRIAWQMAIPPGTESSPLAIGRMLYFGDQSGVVRAVHANTGRVLWTYHAAGAVKGGVSSANGILYFADYNGRAYAVRADGHPVWAVTTNGADLGFGSGNFYSTPAIAFGRVYIGNTDGRVYSFAAATGQLAWATSTGAYVYSSPAVANVPGLGPTVYIGSYDGHLYAFNARSGSVRWAHNAGGRISGSPTIVGSVVYYSNLAAKTTTGLNVRTGRPVFSFPAGSFNPIIADPSAIYLTGYSSLYQLLPRHAFHRRRR